jgi:hypothetical protein
MRFTRSRHLLQLAPGGAHRGPLGWPRARRQALSPCNRAFQERCPVRLGSRSTRRGLRIAQWQRFDKHSLAAFRKTTSGARPTCCFMRACGPRSSASRPIRGARCSSDDGSRRSANGWRGRRQVRLQGVPPATIRTACRWACAIGQAALGDGAPGGRGSSARRAGIGALGAPRTWERAGRGSDSARAAGGSLRPCAG